MKLRSFGISAVALTGLVALSACGSSDSGNNGGTGLTGSVRIDGSSTVAPLTSAAAELFKQQESGVDVTVGTSGTGGGFEKFCRGETDINDASRPIEADEAKACESNGIKFQQLVVANDALTVVVNKENTWATCLTTEQLKKIWEPNSKVASWNQVDSAFPDEPIKLFGPGTDSGTFDYFTAEINGEEGASRTDYTPSEDDNVVVTGVTGSKGGLGYFGYTYFEENQDKLNAVQIDSGAGCVSPSPQTVQDGTYKPLGRPLYVYVSTKALKDNPATVAFLDYYVSNDATIAEQALFIPLNETQTTKLNDEFSKAKAEAGV